MFDTAVSHAILGPLNGRTVGALVARVRLQCLSVLVRFGRAHPTLNCFCLVVELSSGWVTWSRRFKVPFGPYTPSILLC